MKPNKEMTDTKRKALLSTMWIFVLLNMVYADILGMLRPGYLEFLDRMSQQLTGITVLLFAILMEIAISMVLLSRVLDYKANRWVHFIAIPLTILWVIVPSLMPSLGDATPLSYFFFASVEVVTMLAIFWYVWKWPKPERRYNKSW
ncbi:MAG: DUF6326 family protein [Nostocaceae cyanobacterium]|nr:DUF6326 family protein [Nostocaceae cyanobacterium]